MTGKAAVGADIRKRLGHPVIDGDGHAVESTLAMPDFLKEVAGPDVVARWEARGNRSVLQIPPGGYYLGPSGPATIDRAMAMLPRLRLECHERAGIDFAIIYSTMGLQALNIRDDELRRAACRAINMMLADMFAPFKERMTVSAVVPVDTPAEALDELDFVVNELGLRTITINGEVRAPVPEIARTSPELAQLAPKLHPLAVDALDDYDPLWRACVEHGVSVACHGGSSGTDRHSSRTNYVFNHLGTFSTHSEFFCRSLFLGGVTRRFPGLNVAFLEGGVGWACQLYNDICEHWEKRNKDAMATWLDPSKIDVDLLVETFGQYGNTYLTPERIRDEATARIETGSARNDVPDDFAQCGISTLADIRRLFAEPFYFGCESDDRMAAVAFDRRLHHEGATLKPVFGSDIGHWDVRDSATVLADAYALVEDGVMSEADFEAFTFSNAVRLHAGMSPDFFKGTVVEAEAARVMAG